MYEYKCTDLTYNLFQHPATRTTGTYLEAA